MHSIDPFFQKGEGKERYEAYLTCFIREQYMKVLPYRTYAAVSYTHLDVYKRQCPYSGTAACGEAAAGAKA